MHRRHVIFGGLAVAASAALAGCGDDEGAAASGAGLRIGYQRFGGISLVKARAAYPEATCSLFESGPAVTEALKAGAIRLGQTGEGPPIFAAAAKIPFAVAGTSAPVPKGEAVLVKKAKGVRSFADLRGRTVALNKGSNVNWLLVKLLEANGMKLTDITGKYLDRKSTRLNSS